MKTPSKTIWHVVIGIFCFVLLAQAEAQTSIIEIGSNNLKTKITSYPKYTIYDFVSVVAYLPKQPQEVFSLPFHQDVTVSVWVIDPNDPSQELLLFEETVPANKVASGSRKYRYTASGPDLRELEFSPRNSTSTYMYLYAAKGNYLRDLKSVMTPQGYIQFLSSIKTYEVEIRIGNQTWIGVGNPLYADVSPNSHVTLRHNR